MSANSPETIPQIALFIQESSVRPSPPPPQASSSSVPKTSSMASRPMNVAMQHLPPPPPPPPPAVRSPNTSHNPVYCGQSPQPSTAFAISHPRTAVPMFDASRPPPPIHTHVQLNNNTLKRPISNSCTQAGPSKLAKTEEPKPDDALCDVCVQREISIESYRKKMEKISSEDECQTLLFNKKWNEYRRHKDVLRSLVDSNMFRKIEEFMEDVPQYNFHSVLNDLNDSFLTELTSSIPKQMLLQFMDYFLSNSSKFESSQTMNAEDSLRQSLSAMCRSPASRSSPDLLQTLQDMLYSKNRSSSSERPGYGEWAAERTHSPVTNGVSSYCQYSNGQREEKRAPMPPAQAPVPATAPVAPPAPPPTVTYPHYPPPRAYYPPPYPPAPRASTSRAPGPPRPPRSETYPPPYYYYH